MNTLAITLLQMFFKQMALMVAVIKVLVLTFQIREINQAQPEQSAREV